MSTPLKETYRAIHLDVMRFQATQHRTANRIHVNRDDYFGWREYGIYPGYICGLAVSIDDTLGRGEFRIEEDMPYQDDAQREWHEAWISERAGAKLA